MVSDEALEKPSAGWHVDPFGRHERRWWDGSRWTEKVSDRDTRSIDPPGIEEAPKLPRESRPADPIDDALLPLRPPRAATQIALIVGTFVLIGLIVVILLLTVTG